MLLLTIITLFLQFQSLNCQPLPLDANFISLDEKILAIERLMITPGTIDFQVAPCDFLLNGPFPGQPGESGDQTAAEWVRTVFHDFITANVTAGTGGLDASVGFETTRPENLGTILQDENFITRTIIGFNLFSSVFISTSDFIALGIAEAVLSCDPNSPMIKLRAGRIDATEAGPTGVPGPSDPLASQQAAFANAGFSHTEMIQAVACGHSIGGVHGANFPQIVGNQATLGTDEVDFFDDTPYLFDNVGVQRYLSGEGKAGGPLVTTTNSAFKSDLHIFESDGNATVSAMAASQSAFENACFPIFEKMINTVPKNVTLSNVIGPRQWITMFSNLDLTSTGAVTFSGRIGTYSKTTVPVRATYSYGYTTGGTSAPFSSQPGVLQSNLLETHTDDEGDVFSAFRFPFFGNTTFYDFNDTFPSTGPTINSFNIGGSNEGTYTEAINLNLFVVPSLSFYNFNANNSGPILVRAAVLSSLNVPGTTLTATLYYPTGQANSVSPAYKQTSAPLTFYKMLGAYAIYSGIVSSPVLAIQPNNGGDFQLDVKLGTGLRSPKAQVQATIGRGLFTHCGKADLTQCP